MATTLGYVVANATRTRPLWTEEELYKRFTPTKMLLDKGIPPIWYVLGITGNILAFVVWIQKKMRHSSGCYLAALALADLYFLICNIIHVIHHTWDMKILDYPFVCGSFMLFYMASQYLSPILILAFTTERYISICHPFLKDRLCSAGPSNRTIALRTVLGIFLFSFALSAIQPYLLTYSEKHKVCNMREGVEDVFTIWSWITEMAIFVTLPIATLVINVLVVREAIRIANSEQLHLRQNSGYKHTTTLMLLSVSFYYIVTALPVAVTYSLYSEFAPGNFSMSEAEILADSTWQRHFDYMTFQAVIRVVVGLSHYALNFYIYLLTGKLFRNQFFDLFKVAFSRSWKRTGQERGSLMTFKSSSLTFSTGRSSLKVVDQQEISQHPGREQEHMV